MGGESVEAAIDDLYAVALDEFTEERTRLAKELRSSGNREGADAVAKLRKPAVAAWVLNQLARRHRRDVDLLLDAGHRLRETQVSVLGGAERQEFERARKAEADALGRLTRDAEKLLRERGGATASVLKQVVDSLRAAAISPIGREQLARGRFTQPLKGAGFDVFSDLPAATKTSRAVPAQKARKQEELRAARDAVRAAKQRVRSAEQQVRTAEKETARLRVELEASERDVNAERDKLNQAIEALEAARRRLR